MSKVDWSLAPEGATHFGPANEDWRACWHKWSNGELLGWLADGDKNWTRTTAAMGSTVRLSSLIERPQPKPWSGPEDGLPPVGTKVIIGSADGCEWLEHFEGLEAEIIAHNVARSGEPTAVFKCFDDKGFPKYHALVADNQNFLPVSNHKQLAADKRETAIREIMDIAQVDCRVTAARLVDAGFKREVV